uniref:Uncharacterized protein n=1 Tax=Pseudonaja textilis TaxID=8673 RepID=A0A670Z092_PSETE
MTGQVPCSGWLLLLLLLGQGRAKPRAEIQVRGRLHHLVDFSRLQRSMGSLEKEGGDVATLDQPDVAFPWSRSLEEHPLDFQQLLRELLSSTRTHQSRSKKGPSRSCFGAKLDPIGAFSGMGC